MTENFTPSPMKLVRFVRDGRVVKVVAMNRKERRSLGIRGKAK